jgi:hypothetical protein
MTSIYAATNDAADMSIFADLRRGILVGAAVLVLMLPSGILPERPVFALADPDHTTSWHEDTHFADFRTQTASGDARYLADWIADSHDNAGYDFVIVDKKSARLYVFDDAARLRGSSTILLGAARGDDTVPGIGSRPIADVRPEERTTPAGRFVAERGRDARGDDVVWLDYDAGVAMHRVLTTNIEEHRLERLASPALEDKRISYGCINVPAAFYEAFVRPTFATRRALVYVLPESKPVSQVFDSYDVRPTRRSSSLRLGKSMAAPCNGPACDGSPGNFLL